MGLCVPKPEGEGGPGGYTYELSESEQKAVECQRNLGIAGTRYSVYEHCLKRYGYVGGTVTDAGLNQISNETGIDMSDIDHQGSFAHHCFRNGKVMDHGNYNVEYLLLLGFLTCFHLSEEKAADNLWGIVNPTLEDSVSKDRLREILEKMFFWCIEVPLTYEQTRGTDSQMIEYYTAINQKKEKFLQDMIERLPGDLSRQEFLQTMGPKWYAAYRIRGNICPEKARQG